MVIEAYPPGYLDAINLGYSSLSESRKGLIMASITGFGQDGPRRNDKYSDLTVSAYGGAMSMNGAPSKEPLSPYGSQSFYSASLFAAIGILLAHRKKMQTGEGEHLDISMQESVSSTLDHCLVRYFYEDHIAERSGQSY